MRRNLSGRFPWGVRMVLLCGAGLLVGCGGPARPAVAPVQGKITCGGQPVPEGVVTFYPKEGRSASGRIQPDGAYRLTTFEPGDGALLGEHKVTIEAVQFTGGGPQPKSIEDEIRLAKEKKPAANQPPKAQWLVPPRYAKRETTPLTFEVRPGQNTANFDLPRQ
jgi:hypothetical protein